MKGRDGKIKKREVQTILKQMEQEYRCGVLLFAGQNREEAAEQRKKARALAFARKCVAKTREDLT